MHLVPPSIIRPPSSLDLTPSPTQEIMRSFVIIHLTHARKEDAHAQTPDLARPGLEGHLCVWKAF
jgi:hypothetical protein